MKSVNYTSVETRTEETIKTGNQIFDNFLSLDGGFVIGRAIFLTGTPGAGKTTLSIIIQKLLEQHKTCLYSREMSASSVKSQMKRYSIEHENAYISDSKMCPTLDSFIEDLNEMKPKVVIIDSLQVIMKEDYSNMSAEASGFHIIQKLRAWTDENNAVLIVVGHVNKDGEFEGRNTIQHMFDSHLEMIFDKKKNTRTISWGKNRTGAVGGILYYEFGKDGIDFFTEESFEAEKNKKSLEDFMFDAIIKYTDSVNKKNSNYNSFKKELKSKISALYKVCGNDVFNANIQSLYIVKELSDKYKI